MHSRESGTIAAASSACSCSLAEFAVDAGDDERANQILAEIEEWGADPADRLGTLAYALISRGFLARRLGHLQRAKDHFTDAAARFDRSGDIYGRAIARELLGLVECECGEHALAAANFLDSLVIGERSAPGKVWSTGSRWWRPSPKPSANRRDRAAGLARSKRRWRFMASIFHCPSATSSTESRHASAPPWRTQNWAAGRQLSLDRVTEEAASWLDEISDRPGVPIERR